jgi:hypothetical protein
MNIRQQNLLEGKILLEARVTRKLWESAGKKIVEAQLTPDQIKQLFQQVEQGVTTSGGNRTGLGKTKDTAEAVNKAWEDLKTKIQNSKPMTNFDQAMSDQLSKIGMGAKDPQFNGQVSQWVQKYRDFAKKHPIAQSAIYGTLIALSGLTGAGIPGIAALGLLKMADKVLQGERFSSALYSGGKTALMTFAASKLGELLRGVKPGQAIPHPKPGAELPNVGKMDFEHYDYFLSPDPNDATVVAVPKGMGSPWDPSSAAYAARMQLAAAAGNAVNESRQLSESQIYVLFGMMNGLTVRIDEGILDWAKIKGHNLTTKVTADKLAQAWKKAGSPTDSDAIAKILASAGVPPETITSAFSSMSIPTSASTNTPAIAPANTTGQQSGYQFIIATLPKLTKQEKTNLLALLQK